MQSMTWYRVPTRRELLRRKWKKYRKSIRRAAAGALTVAGILLAMMTETTLACGWAGLGCLCAALIIRR